MYSWRVARILLLAPACQSGESSTGAEQKQAKEEFLYMKYVEISPVPFARFPYLGVYHVPTGMSRIAGGTTRLNIRKEQLRTLGYERLYDMC